jgi:hypothetical protein
VRVHVCVRQSSGGRAGRRRHRRQDKEDPAAHPDAVEAQALDVEKSGNVAHAEAFSQCFAEGEEYAGTGREREAHCLAEAQSFSFAYGNSNTFGDTEREPEKFAVCFAEEQEKEERLTDTYTESERISGRVSDSVA